MYGVLDVCRYVIKYSNEQNYGVSNLKLQKLLYFIQAYFLINSRNKKCCFSEKIEAWDFGPVVPVAYREYKQYGSTDIPTIDFYLNFDADNIWDTSLKKYDYNCISDEDKKLINNVIDKFSNYSATDLVNITHDQAPWKNVYVPYENNEISIDVIKDYFSAKQ